MRIEISNGYVEMMDTLKRRISRHYYEVLDQHSAVGSDGSKAVNMLAIEMASQQITLDMITRVVKTDADGVQTEVTDINIDWLDDLDEPDYKKIERHALNVLNRDREKAKK